MGEDVDVNCVSRPYSDAYLFLFHICSFFLSRICFLVLRICISVSSTSCFRLFVSSYLRTPYTFGTSYSIFLDIFVIAKDFYTMLFFNFLFRQKKKKRSHRTKFNLYKFQKCVSPVCTLRWRWAYTKFPRNFVWRKKTIGQNSTEKMATIFFCMSREFAGGATLRWRWGHTKFLQNFV